MDMYDVIISKIHKVLEYMFVLYFFLLFVLIPYVAITDDLRPVGWYFVSCILIPLGLFIFALVLCFILTPINLIYMLITGDELFVSKHKD